uniref:flagellin n=1 Tax=Polynucleobacter sp. TaxID=2029855 RepID=UPI0040481113
MGMPLSGLANTLSSAIAKVQNDIVDVQNQLASGKKTLNPAENGIVTRLSAQADAYNSVENNISNAKNVIAVGQTSLQSVATILTQMKSLATQASSSGLTASDATSLQTTFASLAAQIADLGTGADVNGSNLLAGGSISVTTGINGNTASATTVTGVDVATIASTASALSIAQGNAGSSLVTKNAVSTGVVVGVPITQGTAGVYTLTLGALANTELVSIKDGTNEFKFTMGSNGATAAQVTAAVANFINTGLEPASADGVFLNVGGGAIAAFRANYTAAVNGTELVLTQTSAALAANPAAKAITVGVTTPTAGKMSAITTTTAPVVRDTTGTSAEDRIVFTALAANQSITVGGLTFTSSGATSAVNVATAFHNFIQTGATSANGTFSGNSYATMATLYQSGVAANESSFSNGTGPDSDNAGILYIKTKASGVTSIAVSSGSAVENANAAIASLTTLISTTSTGQSSLSAANTGLSATLSAVQALKSGLQNTVDTIQNIDATAMQAKLQQLNNQQSIDYYLVSQMNTQAAAILSIFR